MLSDEEYERFIEDNPSYEVFTSIQEFCHGKIKDTTAGASYAIMIINNYHISDLNVVTVTKKVPYNNVLNRLDSDGSRIHLSFDDGSPNTDVDASNFDINNTYKELYLIPYTWLLNCGELLDEEHFMMALSMSKTEIATSIIEKLMLNDRRNRETPYDSSE